MDNLLKKEDIKEMYMDLERSGNDKEAKSMLFLIMYLQYQNVSISDYIKIRQKKVINVHHNTNLKLFPIPDVLDGLLNEEIINNRTNFYYPNFFIQGYITSYLYSEKSNNRGILKEIIESCYSRNSRESISSYTQFCKGSITYFNIKYKINEIHEYLYIVTKRSRDKDNIKKTFNIDLFSVWLLVKFNKNSIWDIDKEDFNTVIKILKKYCNKNGRINEVSIKEIFGCRFSEIINWWRAAYLRHENIRCKLNPLNSPPKRMINYRELYEIKNIEGKLEYSFNMLLDKSKIKEIQEVYNHHCNCETHNSFVNGKINNFIKYHNYCLINSKEYTETDSLKRYVEEICYEKPTKSKNELINKLRGYFEIAIKIGYYQNLTRNPVSYSLNYASDKFAKLPDDKVIPESAVKKIFMIENQLSKFERLFIRLLYYTGLRVGEALLLTVGCIVEITTNAVVIVVPPFKQREKPYSILIEDLEVIKVIEELIELRSQFGKVPNFETGEAKLWLLVEVSDEGTGLQHISRKRGNQIIDKACKLAGIKRYTNHCFRHTFVHRKLNIENYDYEDVALLLGHAGVETLVIYSRLTNEERLRFFSNMQRRKKAVLSTKENKEIDEIKINNSKYKICISNCHNRWCGNGWCNTEGTVKCPKRYISHYTCPLFKPDVNNKDEIVEDFYANMKLLEYELQKKYPITKDVILFVNILNGIIKNLESINICTYQFSLDVKEVVNKAKCFLEGED